MALKTAVQDGEWSDPATWDAGVPAPTDTVRTTYNVTVGADGPVDEVCAGIEFDGNEETPFGVIRIDADSSLTVNGNATLFSEFGLGFELLAAGARLTITGNCGVKLLGGAADVAATVGAFVDGAFSSARQISVQTANTEFTVTSVAGINTTGINWLFGGNSDSATLIIVSPTFYMTDGTMNINQSNFVFDTDDFKLTSVGINSSSNGQLTTPTIEAEPGGGSSTSSGLIGG